MSRLFLPRHHRTHEPGGSDELSRSARTALFGTSYQRIQLQYVGSGAPDLDGTAYDAFSWVTDPTAFSGGYVEATTDGAFFSGLVLLEPKGSVWQFNHRRSTGPDYGRYKVALTSLEYESASRPAGDLRGKIAPVDGGYGSFSYIDLTSGTGFDGYGATASGDIAHDSSLPFIVGGDEGDPLTDFATGITDPGPTGFTLMDGGPGWYRLKIYTSGKHASSSGYRVRISDAILTRRSDDNTF